MKYLEIQRHLEKFRIFSVEDLKILDPHYDKSKIYKWIQAGYIKKIIRGFYTIANLSLDQHTLFEISNKIYAPSYVSLEMAFCYYGVIPEQVFSITAVSPNKTIHFTTDMGFFDYKKIKPELFRGYLPTKIGEHRFLVAELEKAFIDYFYLYDTVKNEEDILSMRFNKQVLQEKLDSKKLVLYAKLLGSAVVQKRVALLNNYLQSHD